MNIKILGWFLGAFVAGTASVSGQERPISLAEAVTQAQQGSRDVLAARARAQAADYGARAAGSFRWPTVGIEAGAIRSDDPVAAFGGRLRQGRFSQADFDPAGLNHPDPLTDWSGAVGASWAPLDFSADAGYRAAQAEAEAAGLGAAWAERAAGFRAEARYLEAVGMQQRLRAAVAARESAESNAGVTQKRRDEGLLTDADLLQARAALEGARAGEIDARRILDDARGRLAVALGWPAGQVPVPTDTVFDAPDTSGRAVVGRLDLRASAAGLRAADARVASVRRSRLPRVQGFARLASHSDRALSGAEQDWTVGVQLSLPVFTGFAIRSQERAAVAMREAANQEHELRLREAEARLEEALRGLEAARQGASAAGAAEEAAAEAARLMRRRFEEGLITTADLLAVEAQAAALATQAVSARLGLHMAAAQVAFLTDTDDLTGGSDR